MSVQTLSTACISKELAVQCFYGLADTNQDGMVELGELQKSIREHLPWWQTKAFDFFGGTDRIVRDCDANGDGILTPTEAMAMPATCLESCWKRAATAYLFNC